MAFGRIYDDIGRISKKSYVASTSALLVVCFLSAVARFWIRIKVQIRFGIDDGFFILGLCFICTGFGLMFYYIDDMYMAGALVFDPADTTLPADWLNRVYYYQKMSAISLVSTWCAIVCVKLSFLFFFRKLIERMHSMVIYWRITLGITIIVSMYGIAVYIVACPYYYNTKMLQCGTGSKAGEVFNWSLSQMILDVFTDLMIMTIPIRLIWQIKIRWTQKIILAFSLCLTVVMIVVTIIRASGIMRKGKVLDSLWETFWQFMSAEVGLIITAGTAFRALFVSRQDQNRERNGSRTGNSTRVKILLEIIATHRRWISKNSNSDGTRESSNTDFRYERGHDLGELPQAPRGTMTGVRTFINGRGKDQTRISKLTPTKLMESHVIEEAEDGTPLTQRGTNAPYRVINVQHDIVSSSERISNPIYKEDYV